MRLVLRHVWLGAPLVLVLFCWGGPALAPAQDFDVPPHDQLPPGTDKFEEDDTQDGAKKDDDGGLLGDEKTDLPPKQVNVAIDRGVAWLARKQQANGSWGEVQGNARYDGAAAVPGQRPGYTHPAGPTALAVLALLKCKAGLNHDQVRAGLKFLFENHRIPNGSYERSVLLLALVATGDPHKTTKGSVTMSTRYKNWARDLHRALIAGRTALGWRYQTPNATTPGGAQDLSSTQLATLALFAAHRAGIKTKKGVWEAIIAFTLAQQEAAGPEIEYPLGGTYKRKVRARGFAYILGMQNPDEGQPTGAVTAGAVANLQIARYVLSDGMSERGRKAWEKRPDAKRIDTAIHEGLAWMHANWHASENPKKVRANVYHLYWLYALERAMDLLGQELLGGRRWYVEMGRPLLERQRADGHWNSNSAHRPRDVLDTCFALLFLRRSMRGTIPSVTPEGGDNPADER